MFRVGDGRLARETVMQRPPSDPTINVAICLDRRMLVAAFVLLASIKAHAEPGRPVRVFALTDFEAADLETLATAMAAPAFELVPLACANVHGHFPIRDHITAGTYLRFLLPDLLPQIDKIIYIDVDTVVHRPLDALFDVELDGMALAAMPDWPMLVGSQTWPTFFIPHAGTRLRFAAYVERALGFPCAGTTNYFNCGVMVFDLALWRAQDVAGRAIGYLTDHPGVYYMDQDALNVLMGGALRASRRALECLRQLLLSRLRQPSRAPDPGRSPVGGVAGALAAGRVDRALRRSEQAVGAARAENAARRAVVALCRPVADVCADRCGLSHGRDAAAAPQQQDPARRGRGTARLISRFAATSARRSRSSEGCRARGRARRSPRRDGRAGPARGASAAASRQAPPGRADRGG